MELTVDKKRMPMNLNDYQKKAMLTCMPTSENFAYMMLNLVGEVGEFCSKVAKQIRKDNVSISSSSKCISRNNNSFIFHDYKTKEVITNELMLEAGDILWQLAGLCTVMGWNLDDIAMLNLEKLKARQIAGTIDGNGDGIERDK